MKSVILILVIVTLLQSLTLVSAGSAQDWSSRIIYQLLTDRFALPNNSDQPCDNLEDYCGGQFSGIQQQLDYIQGMGFNAIWISPIVTNYPGGYHGYWQTDITTVNSNFGSSQDLLNLIAACHQRDIWVMLDVVANHVGPVGTDYSQITPFNQQSHYHGCEYCPSQCTIDDFNNQTEVELCRLAGLPDLDQTNPYVSSTLVSWIAQIVSEYGFDGIRIDTVPEVDIDFWSSYVQSAGVYQVGEVYNGDVGYVSPYQDVLDGVLSYPLFFVLRNVFQQQQSMYNIQSMLQSYQSSFKNMSYLGTFIDNHDQARFLNGQSDIMLYRNAITYVLTAVGIPIIYYGTEQEFNGGNDPDNREILWPTQYNTETELYQFIKTINNYTTIVGISQHEQVQRYADDSFYAFTRGNTFVALTNGGSDQGQISRNITYQPYQDGTVLCNIFYPSVDCIKVEDGSFTVYLDNGESKIYHPVSINN